jgi:hypothetical protein
MEILPCPHCQTGTKALVFVATKDGILPLFLNRYSSCSCALSAMDKARLIEQAASEEVRTQ